MNSKGPGHVAARGTTVEVRVKPEEVTRLRIGSSWKVVSSSLDSLWEGVHTVTLEEVDLDKGEA